jgi:hypothetical protein
MPVRFLRNIMNRFWGGNHPPADLSDSSDTEEEGRVLDAAGVD